MGAPRITPEEIIEMQRLYRQLGTYTAVANEIGRSPSSVSKYVQMKGIHANIRIVLSSITGKTNTASGNAHCPGNTIKQQRNRRLL